jgi:regulator of sigma E protease
VLAVDGAPVADFPALQTLLLDSEGAPLDLRLARNGEERTVGTRYRPPARVDGLSPGGAAEAAGLRVGDVVVAVDGAAIDGFSDLQRLTRQGDGAPMTLTVQRDGATFETVVTPRVTEVADALTGAPVRRPLLGVQKMQTEVSPEILSVGPLGALGAGVERTWMVIALSLSGIAEVVAGSQPAGEVLGGPIRIAEVSGDAAAGGLASFIGLVAVLSASIGLINLFPIPILDGGHLMFYAVEKLRGRPLQERWLEIGNRIGLALVLSLMLFATFNDIARL